MDDRKIVALYFARNEAAISESDRKYGGALRALSKRIVGDGGVAEECVNDTYLRTWQTVPPKNPESYLYAFFAKIARNFSLDRYRKEHRQKRCEDTLLLLGELEDCIPDSSATSLEELFESELSSLINSYLESKSPEARGIFIYRYFLFKTVEETARHFAVSQGKAKTVLYRMRLELKEYLEERGYSTK